MAGIINQAELPARFCHAYAANLFPGQLCRQISHAARAFRLSVSGYESYAFTLSVVCKLHPHGFRKLAAALTHHFEVRQIHPEETQPGQDIIAVRYTCKTGGTLLFHPFPERGIQQ